MTKKDYEKANSLMFDIQECETALHILNKCKADSISIELQTDCISDFPYVPPYPMGRRPSATIRLDVATIKDIVKKRLEAKESEFRLL